MMWEVMTFAQHPYDEWDNQTVSQRQFWRAKVNQLCLPHVGTGQVGQWLQIGNSTCMYFNNYKRRIRLENDTRLAFNHPRLVIETCFYNIDRG